MKKRKVFKTPNFNFNKTLEEQLKKFPNNDANWKMFHQYVNMMALITKEGGVIICKDPDGIARTFINN